jgi:hypothetical protein
MFFHCLKKYLKKSSLCISKSFLCCSEKDHTYSFVGDLTALSLYDVCIGRLEGTRLGKR